MPAPVFSAKLTLACCPPLRVASLSHAHSHGAACACALSMFWLHWSWNLKPSAMLSLSTKPLRVVAYRNLLPSCPDLGSCRSLLEIFNAPLRSKVRDTVVVGVLKRFELTTEKLRPFAIRGLISFVQAVPGAFRLVQRRKSHAGVLDRLT